MSKLATALEQRGWNVETAETHPEGGAAPAARYALERRFAVAVVCGGDGTVHEVVNVFAHAPAGEAPTVALAPLGTANILAGVWQVPRRCQVLADWLATARPRPLPLGRSTGSEGARFFVAVASAGLDAAVVHELDLAAKRRWGKLAYAGAAAIAWRRYRPAPLSIHADGAVATANLALFSLTAAYGGKMRLGRCPEGESIALGVSGGRAQLALQALWLAVGRLEAAPGVVRWRTQSLRIDTPGVPVELDGEAAGHTPVTWECVPSTLRRLGK